jgi:hypothetical protein
VRRITISLDDEVYLSLVDYAASEARTDMSRLSISRTMQKIMQEKLGKLNYYPPKRLVKVPPLLKARGRTLYSENDSILIHAGSLEDSLRLANSSYLSDMNVK